MGDDTRTGRQLISTLVRRRESGGVWRVRDRNPPTITVMLLRCDAGEAIDQITSGDPEWLKCLQREGAARIVAGEVRPLARMHYCACRK